LNKKLTIQKTIRRLIIYIKDMENRYPVLIRSDCLSFIDCAVYARWNINVKPIRNMHNPENLVTSIMNDSKKYRSAKNTV